jgi:hypothetical protein
MVTVRVVQSERHERRGTTTLVVVTVQPSGCLTSKRGPGHNYFTCEKLQREMGEGTHWRGDFGMAVAQCCSISEVMAVSKQLKSVTHGAIGRCVTVAARAYRWIEAVAVGALLWDATEGEKRREKWKSVP